MSDKEDLLKSHGPLQEGVPSSLLRCLDVHRSLSTQGDVIQRDPIFLVVAIVIAISAFFWMKRFLWDLVDEVYDSGDALLVRNNGKEDTVAIAAIMNVSVSTLMNPPRISLRLATPSKFRNEISFVPAGSSYANPFTKNKVAEDLIVRVDEARLQRRV